jgi:hypothetical protein
VSEIEQRDVVLTPELKDKLKGFVGFTVDAPFVYVPKVYRENDIPKGLWPTYELKSKDGVELAETEDQAGYIELRGSQSTASRLRMQTGTARIATLRDGILKVKNQPVEGDRTVSYDKASKTLTTKGADGKEHIKNGADVKSLIRLLPIALQVELQEAINERSVLSEEELQGLT